MSKTFSDIKKTAYFLLGLLLRKIYYAYIRTLGCTEFHKLLGSLTITLSQLLLFI